MLTQDQKIALRIIMDGRNVFITGIPGSGKSYLINYFVSMCSKNKKIALTATTGLAATSIASHSVDLHADTEKLNVLDMMKRAAGINVEKKDSKKFSVSGTTIHHFSGAGLFNQELPKLISRIKRNKHSKKRWLNTDVLIIDEVSMLPPTILDMLDLIARAIRNCDKPFGGIQMILVGDFNQTEPVYKNGRPNKVYAFEADSWKYITHKYQLTTNMRQNKDSEFRDILSRVRTNTMTARDKELINERLGKAPPLNSDCIMVYSHNIDVDAINNRELARTCSDESDYKLYQSAVIITEKGNGIITEDYIRKSVLCPQTLKLCIGCKVMLLANLDVSAGLANGAIGFVESFCGGHPQVRFSEKPTPELITPYTWNFEEDGHVIGALTQYPLKLAYAATVHKTQGQTFKCACMDLSRVFAHGMLYTALSRVKSLDGLYLRGINWKMAAVDKAIQKFNKDILDCGIEE